jgi:8-oxo-dGTP pyrophosphatase MutT (NUDIX family)
MRQRIEAGLRTAEELDGSRPAQPLTGDFDLNPVMLDWVDKDESLMAAAVLVPIVEREELTVLLTKRTDHLHHHAGQISFPGGRVEPRDKDCVDTALRETEEEIGLGREFVEIAGYLDEYRTGTGFHIIPVVGFVRPGFELDLDDFEVAEAFEVPLSFLFDPANHQRHARVWEGKERRYYAMPYGDYFIWGATAGMLMNLYRRVHGERAAESEVTAGDGRP